MENKSIKERAIELIVDITNTCDGIKGRSVYTNQLMRCASSIGANASEAQYAQSPADFIHKLELSLKECNETDYWLEILYRLDCIHSEKYKSLSNQNGAIKRMLIASITTVKSKL